ncbi:MAG: DinB family protein, partial [Saprospiraceae bacterium]|nr:DinB family protein [Saprospiraceae bacterium]
MAGQWKNEFLAELHTAYEAIYTKYEQQTKGLNEAQLNWKPNADKWSVAECLQHLIITAEGYLPQVAKQL